MTTQFDKPLSGFTFVATQRGDTLQKIAARVFGDAAQWYQLIAYNNLVPPYITDDPTVAGPGVLLTGQQILVPAPFAVAPSPDPTLVFGSDIGLQNGSLGIDPSGDFATVSGRANLTQGLQNVVETEAGELIYHTAYGSKVRTLMGKVSNQSSTLLAAQYAKGAVLSDSRVASVNTATATVNGDVTAVSVEVVPIVGQPITVTATP